MEGAVWRRGPAGWRPHEAVGASGGERRPAAAKLRG